MHPWAMRALVVIGCLLTWRDGRRRTALVVAATLVAGSAAGAGLKLLIRRERPPFGDDVAAELGYSMPSGHALNGALGLGLLLVLAWPWLRARGWRGAAVAVAVVLGLVVCTDRLVLGVHYLSDVTVGAAVGAGLAAGAAAASRSRSGASATPSRSRTGLGDPTRRSM
jgi:undecaprenyl-diphosphatase